MAEQDLTFKETAIRVIFGVKGHYTVLSLINGHSKRRTPLISGQFSFPRRNPCQTLIENFLKSRQIISGHSKSHLFIHEISQCSSFQLDTFKNN